MVSSIKSTISNIRHEEFRPLFFLRFSFVTLRGKHNNPCFARRATKALDEGPFQNPVGGPLSVTKDEQRTSEGQKSLCLMLDMCSKCDVLYWKCHFAWYMQYKTFWYIQTYLYFISEEKQPYFEHRFWQHSMEVVL